MDMGFLIDQRKCIGCHACTVACKAENQVPVGSFRTWVKYVEKGVYPDTRRFFTVLRCNHCDAAPCVTICPVNALEKRPDKIVDLNRDRCIGCRACMQACPYDALYLNEDRGVAEKCHFCAHRTEIGLEPACVVVCPEQAIVAGDTSDPESEISTLIRDNETSRRKPEKGTDPRVWYVDAEEEGLRGGGTIEPERWMWSDRAAPPPPATEAGRGTGEPTTTVLNADHPPAWGAHVWGYLPAKNLSAGIMLAAPFLMGSGAAGGSYFPEVVSLAALAVTLFLLVADLGRPERFLRLLITPNRQSWLVKGAWALTAFGSLTVLSLYARVTGRHDLDVFCRIANLPFAALAAGYSAFLFRQCKARELWHERGLFAALVLRAAFLGAAFSLTLPWATGAGPTGGILLVVLGGANVLYMLSDHLRIPQTRESRAAHEILVASGDRDLAIALFLLAAGIGVPIAVGAAPRFLGGVALAAALFGEIWYERAWIRAGQAVPLS